MRLALFPIIVSLLAGCATTPEPSVTTSEPGVVVSDPIERLVARLSSSHGLWQNGEFPKLNLSATASTEQVVSRVFRMTGFDKGHVAKHRILETRQVRIFGSLPDIYTAVLVDTDLGRKIVLLKHDGPVIGWWSRVYDAGPTAAIPLASSSKQQGDGETSRSMPGGSFFPGNWIEVGSHPLAPLGLNVSTSGTFTVTERVFFDEIGEKHGRSWVTTNVLTGTWLPAGDAALHLKVTNSTHHAFTAVRTNDMVLLVSPHGATNVLRRTQETRMDRQTAGSDSTNAVNGVRETPRQES